MLARKKKAKTGQSWTASNKETEYVNVRSETASKLRSSIHSMLIQSVLSRSRMSSSDHSQVFDRETSSALTHKQKSLLTLVRFSQRLSQDLTPQPLIELRWPISSGVCNTKTAMAQYFWRIQRIFTRLFNGKSKLQRNTTYPNVLRIQTVFAPR